MTENMQPTSKDWRELSFAGAGIALQLAMEIDKLKAQNARAVELLNHCIGFFNELDFDHYPPTLDSMIREYLRTVKPPEVQP